MKGSKYKDDILLQAFSFFAAGKRPKEVADLLNIPLSTVQKWNIRWNKKGFKLQPESAGGETLNLAQVSSDYKKEFIAKSWALIGRAQEVLSRRLERAVQSEDSIDELVLEIENLDRDELNDLQRKVLHSKIATIKIESVKELAVVLGTLYDKQALANKEPTSIVDAQVRKFEDFDD